MQPFRKCPVVSPGDNRSLFAARRQWPLCLIQQPPAWVCDITASSRPVPQCNTRPGPSSCLNSPHVVTVRWRQTTWQNLNEPDDTLVSLGSGPHWCRYKQELMFGSTAGFYVLFPNTKIEGGNMRFRIFFEEYLRLSCTKIWKKVCEHLKDLLYTYINFVVAQQTCFCGVSCTLGVLSADWSRRIGGELAVQLSESVNEKRKRSNESKQTTRRMFSHVELDVKKPSPNRQTETLMLLHHNISLYICSSTSSSFPLSPLNTE